MRAKSKDDPHVIKEREKGIIAIIVGKIMQSTYSEPLYSAHKEITIPGFTGAYRCLMPPPTPPLVLHAFATARCLIRNNFPGGKISALPRELFYPEPRGGYRVYNFTRERCWGDNFTFSRGATRKKGHIVRARPLGTGRRRRVENAWKPRMIFFGIPRANGTNWRRRRERRFSSCGRAASWIKGVRMPRTVLQIHLGDLGLRPIIGALIIYGRL